MIQNNLIYWGILIICSELPQKICKCQSLYSEIEKLFQYISTLNLPFTIFQTSLMEWTIEGLQQKDFSLLYASKNNKNGWFHWVNRSVAQISQIINFPIVLKSQAGEMKEYMQKKKKNSCLALVAREVSKHSLRPLNMVKHWRVHWREKLFLVAEPQRELGKKMPCKWLFNYCGKK